MKNYSDILSLLIYQDGNLFWKEKQNKNHCINTPAGTVNKNGYRVITHGGKKYQAHRLVWALHGLELPEILDHINGDKLDNRMENLRQADISTNSMNSKLKADNKSGVRGVSWCNTFKKWTVQLLAHGKKVTARFKDFEEARTFAEAKRREIHGEFFSMRGAS